MKLINIFNNIINDIDYNKLDNELDKNIFESYYLIGELLNPNNSYKYKEHETLKHFWYFIDNHSGEFFVRLLYQPTLNPYFEIKMGWLDVNNKEDIYKRSSKREIDDKRSDTIAKIYKDEILKTFLKLSTQLNCNELLIKPLDIKRYQFSIRLVNKFTPTDVFEIDESNKPKEIKIKIKI
jgi:hypothetical protein